MFSAAAEPSGFRETLGLKKRLLEGALKPNDTFL